MFKIRTWTVGLLVGVVGLCVPLVGSAKWDDSGGSGSVSNEAYNATTWDGETAAAPSKNAVRDKIEAMAGGGDVGSVGDCTEGTCNDGSADGGTYLRLYDGTSAYESITGGVRTFTFASSTAGSEDLVLTLGANDNLAYLSSSTGVTVLTLTGIGLNGTGFVGGTNDVLYGKLTLYSSDVNTGGAIDLYTSADHDSTINKYSILVLEDRLEIGPDTNSNAMTMSGSNVVFEGTLSTGVAGSVVGSLAFNNATSGAITVQPITGALGASTLVLGTTYTDAKWCSYATATGFTCAENAPSGSSQASLHVDDILTALGIASEAVHFGTFTGATIPDNATAKSSLQALETALELKSNLASPLFTGKIYLGDNANTTMTQGATLNQGANDDEVLAFKSSDVGHPFTADAEADTYAHFLKTSATAGGLSLTAFTDATLDGALSLIGVIGATDPTDAHSAVVVKGRKSGGTDAVAVLGNAETVFRVDNHNTALLTTLGNGNATFAGTLTTPGLIVTKSTGVPGINLLYEATTTETLGIGWKGPNSRVANDLYLQFPDSDPAAGQFMLFAAPATDLSLETAKATWTTYGSFSGAITLVNGETISNADDTEVAFNGTEAIALDLDAGTNMVAWKNRTTSSTGVTDMSFSALNLATTGTIQGGVKINTDVDGMSQAEMTAVGMYGTMFFATGAGTWLLPDAVEGMSFCVYSTTAAHIVLDPDSNDDITLNGTLLANGYAVTNNTADAAGDFICMVAQSNTHWFTLGRSGTWTDIGS